MLHWLMNLDVKFFDDMRYYNTTSSIFVQDCITGTNRNSMMKSWIDSIWKLLLEDRI